MQDSDKINNSKNKSILAIIIGCLLLVFCCFVLIFILSLMGVVLPRILMQTEHRPLGLTIKTSGKYAEPKLRIFPYRSSN